MQPEHRRLEEAQGTMEGRIPIEELLSPRESGKVKRIGPENFGFIESDAGSEVYFRPSWLQDSPDSPPLAEEDRVQFRIRTYENDSKRADDITREGEPDPGVPKFGDWAFVGYYHLDELKSLALCERWDFRNEPRDPARPFPILWNYLRHTFGRLAITNRIAVDDNRSVAAFNTGLVDARYQSIYALFHLNAPDRRQRWLLEGFCIPGEGNLGKKLVSQINPLPDRAHYFDNPADLFYDTREGTPKLDQKHILIDRIDRYPNPFLAEFGYSRDTAARDENERENYYRCLGQSIESNVGVYRRMVQRINDAVELSVKRTMWNYKTAVPQYYPQKQKITLLLPLCIVADDQVDLALVVERTESRSYVGHTVLSLDVAYNNARLLCRPDSDWLVQEVPRPLGRSNNVV